MTVLIYINNSKQVGDRLKVLPGRRGNVVRGERSRRRGV